MDLLSRLFLESPVRLGVFSFLLFAVSLFVRRQGTPVSRYVLPAALALIFLLFVIQNLIVTQRERIWQRLDELIAAVERRDDAALRDAFSSAYAAEGMDQPAVLDQIDAMLKNLRVWDTRATLRDVTVRDEAADMDLLASATISIQGGVGERHVGRWRLRWIREADEWRIQAVDPRMIDAIQVAGWRELRGLAP